MSIYQFVVKGSLSDGTELRNVLHYEFTGYTPNTTELQEAVDDLDDHYKSNLQSYFTDNLTMGEYEVRRVDIGDQPASDFTVTGGTWAGSNVSDQLPAQLAVLVSGSSGTAFPRTVRSYLFPFTSANITGDGLVLAAARTAAGAWGTDSQELAITGQLNANRVAVKYGGDPRAVTDSNQIKTASGKSKFATQRSRRLGVGI